MFTLKQRADTAVEPGAAHVQLSLSLPPVQFAYVQSGASTVTFFKNFTRAASRSATCTCICNAREAEGMGVGQAGGVDGGTVAVAGFEAPATVGVHPSPAMTPPLCSGAIKRTWCCPRRPAQLMARALVPLSVPLVSRA